MGGSAGASDDDLNAALLSGLGVFDHPVGRAMRADDLRLKGHTELFEDVGGPRHRLPIGVAAHDHPDTRTVLHGTRSFPGSPSPVCMFARPLHLAGDGKYGKSLTQPWLANSAAVTRSAAGYPAGSNARRVRAA